jgi:hypothetical protein
MALHGDWREGGRERVRQTELERVRYTETLSTSLALAMLTFVSHANKAP